MSAMDTDDVSVVLSSTTGSGLSISLHPLPILNISEHLTRTKLQNNLSSPLLIGALLGTQNGRDVEIVNTFELVFGHVNETTIDYDTIDHAFFLTRYQQYQAVFPSLEIIGWYTVAPKPTKQHIALNSQFTEYCTTPLLLLLESNPSLASKADGLTQSLPFKAYESTVELKDRQSRSVFAEAPYRMETGEAERIAVDWTARGGGSGTSLESHLQTQRAAVKMLHDRIVVLVRYVTDALAGQAPRDPAILRSISALVASLPASENKSFREEFDTEYADVQLTAYLSSLTKSTNILNNLVDKHLIMTAGKDERGMGQRRRQGMGGRQQSIFMDYH